MASQFAHLHVHTDYSMLDGAAKIDKLVAEAKRQGMNAIAITDHGYLYGAYEFYRACKKAEIKPIIGLEAYMTPGTSRFDKQRVQWGTKEQQAVGDDVSARGAYTHMTLLAETTTGMHNLFRMGSLASLEGQLGKWPRIDRELLETYSKGLIGSTGCPSGEVQTKLRLGLWDEARRTAGELQDIFGRENFFVEIMDHGLDLESRVVPDLIRLSKDLGAPLLATNDSHYVLEEDREVQDALLCINSGSVLDDPNRFRFDGSGYFLRTAEDMRRTFADYPEACDNTLLIAERCDVSFVTAHEGANFMPHFPVPDGEDEHSWFVKEVERGLHTRFPRGIPDQARKQAEYEAGVITDMGFPGYFLVVADFIAWAKARDIRVGPGRGSGAGSMVAYAMGITELNPLEHGLLFERFLNPERVSMPDFDVDFDERRRGEVIDYVGEKYGHDRVAQVVTYGTIKTKQALKDSARVLSHPYKVGDDLTKAMPPSVMGKDIPLKEINNPKHERYAEAEEFRKLLNSDPQYLQIFELAKGLEGISRQTGVHACAVIMSSEPLTDIIPIMRKEANGPILTQFDYPTCEELGLLKMDFLGLRNLTVISDTIENITINHKTPPDLEHLPLDDKATYEMLSTGETLGLFQLDGAGMRTLLRLMRPDKFGDISAVGALYRPGPMGADSHTNYALRKNGMQEITPIHPELAEPLEEILGETYGLIVYQEQVMAIAQKLAGYSLGQADLLRRAMGKKKAEILDKEYKPFKQGMLDRGYSENAVKTLWDILVPFSNYAFNKSHSAAYGMVSYWTAYLKTHFPTEFMAALLTSQKDNKEKLGHYLAEVRRMGITVLPPDINASAAMFTPVGDEIRFGLAAIRNVGINIVESILETRKELGNFASFQDFLNKVPGTVCSKRVIASLIKAGAFDSFGNSRNALFLCHEEAVDSVVDVKKQEAVGQFDLFGSVGDASFSGVDMSTQIPDIPEWDKKEKLAFEREMLGLYVSDHPLAGMEASLARFADVQISSITSEDGNAENRKLVKIAGLITNVQKMTDRKGNLWAKVMVEDMSGSIEALFFARTYETVSTELVQDAIVTITGRLDVRDDGVTIRAQEMTTPRISAPDAPILLGLAAGQCTDEMAKNLRDILENHSGPSIVRLQLSSDTHTTVVQLPEALNVKATTAFFSDVKGLLGTGCIL
ncbi:MAG: DNA polymerase III subunit alpha [Actinomycetaceae bacterium]|nr:DNA polymerase III subunit alpha [Actinomycetaceae bacterium]